MRMIAFYNQQLDQPTNAGNDPTRISWSRTLRSYAEKAEEIQFDNSRCFVGTYRPFQRQNVYFEKHLNDMVYRLPSIFPTPVHANLGMFLNVGGSESGFSSVDAGWRP